MISPKLSILLAFESAESLLGFMLNTGILAVTFKHWRKGPCLQPYDYIHGTMALINILMQGAVIFTFFLLIIPVLDAKNTFIATYCFTCFLYFFCFWLNACLCVYYLITIANFNLRFFSWLKSHFSVITPKLILVAAVGSFVSGFWGIRKINIHIITGNSTNSSVITGLIIHIDLLHMIISTCVGSFIPFMLSSFCLGYTVMHILMHVCRIKYNNSGSTRPNLQAHIRAARTMVLLFILCLSLNVTQMLEFFLSKAEEEMLIVCHFLTCSFPVAQALIIIQSSAKVRQEFRLKGYFQKVCIGKCGKS